MQETTRVRVLCEAPDCRAVLEVVIDSKQELEKPTVVQCGSCKRLLEVNVSPILSIYHSEKRRRLPPTVEVPNVKTGTVSTGSSAGPSLGLGATNVVLPLVQTKAVKIVRNTSVQTPFPHQFYAGKLTKPRPLSRHSAQDLSQAVVDVAWSTGLQQQPFTWPPIETQHSSIQEKSTKKKRKKNRDQPKKPSPYNEFMSKEIRRIIALNPSLQRKDAFKTAAANWSRPKDSRRNHYGIDSAYSPSTSPERASSEHDSCSGCSTNQTVNEAEGAGSSHTPSTDRTQRQLQGNQLAMGH